MDYCTVSFFIPCWFFLSDGTAQGAFLFPHLWHKNTQQIDGEIFPRKLFFCLYQSSQSRSSCKIQLKEHGENRKIKKTKTKKKASSCIFTVPTLCTRIEWNLMCVGVLCLNCVSGLMKENKWVHPDSLYHILKELHGVHDVLILETKIKKNICHQKSEVNKSSRWFVKDFRHNKQWSF